MLVGAEEQRSPDADALDVARSCDYAPRDTFDDAFLIQLARGSSIWCRAAFTRGVKPRPKLFCRQKVVTEVYFV